MKPEVLAISFDNIEDIKSQGKEDTLPFPLLSDQSGTTSEKFTFIDKSRNKPFPSVFITDRIYNYLPFPSGERSMLLVMHGSPVAVSNIILSERYNFHKETVASLILISSISAGLYLNLWLLLLGH